MGKRLKKLIICFTVLLSVAVFNSFQVAAVNINKECSLTLNECLSGLNIHLYRVGEFLDDGSYQYTDAFSQAQKETNIDLNQLKTSEQLKNAAITLKGYAIKQVGITKKTTSTSLTFTNLKTGYYLIYADSLDQGNTTYSYLPYLIALPQENNYDVSIDYTKYSKNPSHKYSIVKHWKDHGTNRPDKIYVELYEGNKLEKTITLTASNNYAYSWTTKETKNYTIKEKSVKGYKGNVTYTSSNDKTEYIITNTSTSSSKHSSKVKTGDMTSINYWITAMTLAGLTMIVLGSILKDEKD